MSQTEFSFKDIGILNLECAVTPPGNKSDALPDYPTVRTLFPSDLSFAHTFFQRKVFPVPPWPCTNISFPMMFFCTDPTIALYASSWPVFKFLNK